ETHSGRAPGCACQLDRVPGQRADLPLHALGTPDSSRGGENGGDVCGHSGTLSTRRSHRAIGAHGRDDAELVARGVTQHPPPRVALFEALYTCRPQSDETCHVRLGFVAVEIEMRLVAGWCGRHTL